MIIFLSVQSEIFNLSLFRIAHRIITKNNSNDGKERKVQIKCQEHSRAPVLHKFYYEFHFYAVVMHKFKTENLYFFDLFEVSIIWNFVVCTEPKWEKTCQQSSWSFTFSFWCRCEIVKRKVFERFFSIVLSFYCSCEENSFIAKSINRRLILCGHFDFKVKIIGARHRATTVNKDFNCVLVGFGAQKNISLMT